MRRIEDNHPERVILEWQMTEVRNDVRPHFQDAPVNKRALHFPIIAEQDILVLLIEVEHSATAANIKYRRKHFPENQYKKLQKFE